MENELPGPHTSSSASVASSTSGVSSSSGGSGRPTGPQISVYSGIPDRQTVQVKRHLINHLRASQEDVLAWSGRTAGVLNLEWA